MFNNQILEYSAKSSGFVAMGGSAGGTGEVEEPGRDVAETGGGDGEEVEEGGRTVDEDSGMGELS